MITVNEACKIAIDNFVKKDYLRGVAEVVDIGDRWLFFSRFSEEPGVEYGNCPYAVNKETGECKEFPISIIENFELYYNSDPVYPSEIRDEYKL